MQLKMKSSILDRNGEIRDAVTGKSVARIHRRFLNAREIGCNKKTYVVEVQPGADMAIIVTMCICLDEMRKMRKDKKQ
jgi:uncharacterized protein YxjI